MTLINIMYKDGTEVQCLLLPHKNSSQWSYINLTKEHICSCSFPNKKIALKDLDNYPSIESYLIKEVNL